MEFAADIIGIIGVIIVIAAFLLLQMARVQADSIVYLIANLFGSVLIVVSLIYNWNLASFIIEVLWVAISAYGLIRTMSKRRASNFDGV